MNPCVRRSVAERSALASTRSSEFVAAHHTQIGMHEGF
jgi:hypothetical protein